MAQITPSVGISGALLHSYQVFFGNENVCDLYILVQAKLADD